MRPSLLSLALAAASLPGLASAQTIPAGATLQNGAVADVTPTGFDALSDALPALVGELIGTSIPIDDVNSEIGELLGCSFVAYINGLDVSLTINSAALHSQAPDKLLLDLNATIRINSSSDPFGLYVGLSPSQGDWQCFLLSWAEIDCDAYVDPVTSNVGATLRATLVGGQLSLELVSFEQDLTATIDSSDLHLPGCDFYEDLIDLAWGFVADYLESFINDSLGGMLEDALSDAIPPLSFEGETELLDTTLTYSLTPGSLTIGDDTMRIGLDAAFDAPPASCVSAYDLGGSIMTGDGVIPGPFTTVPSTGQPFALDVLLDDDLANNALYVLWRGGVLCYTVDEETIGIPLDTNLLATLLLSSENRAWFTEVFDDASSPILIRTVPTVSPTVVLGAGHDMDAYVEGLDLEFYAWVRDRWARVISVRTDIAAGVDLEYDPTSGDLGIVVDLDTGAITGTVVYNELRPWLTEDIESHFSSAIGALVDPLVGSLLGDLTFTIPGIYGIKLSSMKVEAVGNADDWLGAFAGLTYDPAAAGSGCDADGGCESGCDSGCDSGCETSATPAARAQAAAGYGSLLALGGLIVSRRRRR